MKNKFFIIYLGVLVALAGFFTACSNEKKIISRKIMLSDNWKLQSSAKIANQGGDISTAGQNTTDWYTAKVPSTVMGTLSDNGLYQDLFVATNYKDADKSIFDKSWWYRTEFNLTPDQIKRHIELIFDGVTYRANVWLNGKQIASKDKFYGTFRRHKIDITDYVQENNILAVEVFRAQKGEPNIGFVDWNPRPLDENMGIFREVTVNIEGAVGMKDTWVQSKVDIESLKHASISIQTSLKNYSNEKTSGLLVGKIENINFSIPVTLAPKEKKTLKLTENDVKEFSIDNPRLWWSASLGNPELYNLDLQFIVNNEISSSENVTFGIRDFRSYWTEDGHQGVMLNGKKVLIRSAGWTDDLFLRDTPESNEIQVQYVKDMNLNSIRFENVWGTSQNIYDLCDRYGLIAFVGWSCQWEWEAYLGIPDDQYGCIHSEHDMNLLADYWRDQLTWLRNHASIAVWMAGSDKIPNPTLEKMYLDIKAEVDDRIYIAASQAVDSKVSGPTGMKMFGPYEYVGPNYWFIDRKYGGAYGFNTETGPGPQIPILESIKKMIPEDKLWPLNEVWDYHCTASTTALNSLKLNTEILEAMYGKADNLKDYLDRSHLISYQSTKSMYEAFRVNKEGATGIVQWMLNSAWPSLYWQLYDYEKIPVPAYYGVKRGNKPLQVVYNYADNGIYVINDELTELSNAKVIIKAYDANSNIIFSKEQVFSIASNKVDKITEIGNSAINTLLFLEIIDAEGSILSENFYALSSKPDQYDWDKSMWVGTPMTSCGDFKALTNMPEADLKVSVSKEKDELRVSIENTGDKIAFFVQLLAKDKDGEIPYPIFWNDNYNSLQPKEKKEFTCKYDADKLAIDHLKISGWNINETIITIN